MKRRAVALIAVAALASLSIGGAAAQGGPKLVAKIYPGAVPADTKAGKSVKCGDNGNAYCFLTRDSAEKVRAFYAQEGVKLEPIPAAGVGGGRSNFELALRYQLEEGETGTLQAAPVEFYQTTSAADEPSYFNGVAVMTKAPKRKLQGTDKATLAVVTDDPVMAAIAITPEKAQLMALYGGLRLEPAQLVPHYNRHLAMLGGYFQSVDGESVPRIRLAEAHTRMTAPTYDAKRSDREEDQASAGRQQLSQELKELLKRKPNQRMQYAGVQMQMTERMRAGDKDAKAKAQPELDKILMSDPELAAWKKKRDALDQQTQGHRAQGDRDSEAKQQAQQKARSDPEQQSREVGAYLDGLEKEVHATRIVIHGSEGKRVKRDAATVQGEWKRIAPNF